MIVDSFLTGIAWVGFPCKAKSTSIVVIVLAVDGNQGWTMQTPNTASPCNKNAHRKSGRPLHENNNQREQLQVYRIKIKGMLLFVPEGLLMVNFFVEFVFSGVGKTDTA